MVGPCGALFVAWRPHACALHVVYLASRVALMSLSLVLTSFARWFGRRRANVLGCVVQYLSSTEAVPKQY